jgi:hypothetical protein
MRAPAVERRCWERVDRPANAGANEARATGFDRARRIPIPWKKIGLVAGVV